MTGVFVAIPHVSDEAQALAWAMAGAGADVVVGHPGLTAKGAIGATTAPSLEESAARIHALSDAAAEVKPGHHRALPREVALTENMRRFERIPCEASAAR
jgi:hypothetical protein